MSVYVNLRHVLRKTSKNLFILNKMFIQKSFYSEQNVHSERGWLVQKGFTESRTCLLD